MHIAIHIETRLAIFQGGDEWGSNEALSSAIDWYAACVRIRFDVRRRRRQSVPSGTGEVSGTVDAEVAVSDGHT